MDRAQLIAKLRATAVSRWGHLADAKQLAATGADALERLAAVEQELAEARRDGARLNEAERLKASIRANAMTGKWEVVSGDLHPMRRRYYQGQTLRAAIDAAMQAQKGGKR